ncbi:hypothetical protein [Actinomadura rubrisoli]|uniref:Uncharacterized protein n=1 Tax=Actinomadura rubrisoli TaxID=2530368 RepID=A0A4V2YZK9_9ACTN|nr:hypothetical protein [Actinomadura rubrisoli]TDD97597.1 hypothetical protein E1298_00780 [Actinomadura rubrisoli]
MITAPETLPNLLRAAATIARVTHSPGCPDFAVHRRAAELMDRVAEAEESGARLRVGERDAALRAAVTYLDTKDRAEALA